MKINKFFNIFKTRKNNNEYQLSKLEEKFSPLLKSFYEKELNTLPTIIPPPPQFTTNLRKSFIFSPAIKLTAVSLVIFAMLLTPLINYLFAFDLVSKPLLDSTLVSLTSSYQEEEGVLWAQLLDIDATNQKLLRERLQNIPLKEITIAYLLSKKINTNPVELLLLRKEGLSWGNILRNYHLPPIKTLVSLRKEAIALKNLLKEKTLMVEGSVVNANFTDKLFSLSTFPFTVKFKGALPEEGEEVLIEVKKDNGTYKTETLKLKLKESLTPLPVKLEGKVAKVDPQKGVFYLENINIPIKADRLPAKGEGIKSKGVLKGTVIEIKTNNRE